MPKGPKGEKRPGDVIGAAPWSARGSGRDFPASRDKRA